MGYYLLLLGLPFISACQSIAQKQYTLKVKAPNVLMFSAVTSAIALCFFLITSGFRLDFDARLAPYALVFAVAYTLAWVGTVFAVRFGPMAISTMINSCSLIFPTTYGLLMGEKLTAQIVLGVVMLFSAIVLVNLKSEGKNKLTLRWFGCVMMSFLGNGVCSICQNMQKRALGDSYTHEFMIIALSAAFVLMMTCACLTSKNALGDLKACAPYATGNGVANALVNFLIITLIGHIPNTVLYPSMSALGMTITFLLAFVVYKERFTRPQYIGYVLGVASVVLLNIG